MGEVLSTAPIGLMDRDYDKEDYITILGFWYHLTCPVKPRRIGHKYNGNRPWAKPPHNQGPFRVAYQTCYLCGAKRDDVKDNDEKKAEERDRKREAKKFVTCNGCGEKYKKGADHYCPSDPEDNYCGGY